jgi:hypothetical protein
MTPVRIADSPNDVRALLPELSVPPNPRNAGFILQGVKRVHRFQAPKRLRSCAILHSQQGRSRVSWDKMEEPEVPTEHLQEQIHHQAAHQSERWITGVALSCAILASLAAVASMSSGHYSTEAMVSEIESANQWNYFQAKSIKEAQLRSKTELLSALGKTVSEADTAKLGEYEREKSEIQKRALELGQETKHFLHTHHLLSGSVTLFQIAIAIGAISALTRRRAFWYVSMGFGVLGLILATSSALSMSGP